LCAGDVEPWIVADVENALGRYAKTLAGDVEDRRIRLGDADLARADARAEMMAQANALEIGVAVGNADQREACRERSQGGQSGKTINVTLKIEALANVSSTTFYVRKSTETKPNYDAGTIRAKRGVLTLSLDPLQLVTLSTVK